MKHSFCLFLTFIGFICSGYSQDKLKPDAFEAKLLADKTVQLVDVRTPEEVAQGYIDGALNLNFNAEDFQQNVEKLDKSRPVLLYCAAGGRSARAGELLKKLGFQIVFDLQGGMNAWRKAAKTVKK